MKRLFRWLFRLLLVLVFLLLLLVLLLDPIVKAVAKRQIREQTGMEVKIGKVSIGLKRPTVTVEDFELVSPPEFGGSTFMRVPLFYAEYDRRAMVEKRVHLKLLWLNLSELNIQQDKDGRTNLKALQDRVEKEASSTASGRTEVEFEGIDTLKLTIGKLKFTSKRNPANDATIYVGLKNEIVKNVKSGQDLQPLFARILLERGASFLSESLFNRSTNLLQKAVPAGQKPQPPPAEGSVR